MAKFHINAKGEPGKCSAQSGNCPFGGESDHYSSIEEARDAFESKQESFSVVLKKSSNETKREIRTFDDEFNKKVEQAQTEYSNVNDKSEWIQDKIYDLSEANNKLAYTLPGTAERRAALSDRDSYRENLLAADLVVWRDSEFYNEAVERRMKDTVVNVSDADRSIEASLENIKDFDTVAKEHNLTRRDVEAILEIAHQDYLRPRASLSSTIGDLSDNDDYAQTTANVFRIEPRAVKAVLNHAAKNSNIEKKNNNESFLSI